MMTFGTWLQQRRKALDLTREELAQRVGCSASLVRKLETDARKPSKQMAQILAEQLQVVPAQHEQFVQFARGAAQGLTADQNEAAPDKVLAQATVAALAERPSAPISPSPVAPALPRPAPHFKLQPTVTRPTNLTRPLTTLVGREHELQTLRNRILRDDARLITLAGPPGIGKTQLALELAYGLQNAFEDGTFFVPLAPIAEVSLVAPAIFQALHLSSSSELPAHLALKHLLRDKHMLLVLDNFEHVLPAAALVAELLAECVYIKIIATSRELLRIRGERQFMVPPLLLPNTETASVGEAPDEWRDYPAVSLFVERAQAVDASFQFEAANAPAILEICQSVDGIPLGIELAASWVNALSCAEIAREIRHNLDFLAVNMQDMPARHRSLRAAFDHSWALLPAHEQAALSRLSVFRGGFTREAAEAVANAGLADLSALIAKSLLRRNEAGQAAPAGRYDLHEFIRQYAAEKLKDGELVDQGQPISWPEAQRAHAQFYLALANQALAHSETISADETLWLDRLDDDHDNLRAVLDWARETVTDEALDIGWSLASALWFFWYVRGHLDEGTDRLRSLLKLASRTREPLIDANWAGVTQPRSTAASPLQRAHTRALSAMGWLEAVQNHFDAARVVLDEALIRARATLDLPTVAWTLTFIAHVSNLQNDLLVAHAAAHESITLWQTLGDAARAGWALRILADTALRAGNYASARDAFGQMLQRGHQTSNQVFPMRRLAKAQLFLGEFAQAKVLLHEALQLSVTVQDKIGTVACIAGLAALAFAQNQFERAARLYGVVNQLLTALNTVLESFDRGQMEREMAQLRAQVAPADLARWLREGDEMPPEQAIQYALAS